VGVLLGVPLHRDGLPAQVVERLHGLGIALRHEHGRPVHQVADEGDAHGPPLRGVGQTRHHDVEPTGEERRQKTVEVGEVHEARRHAEPCGDRKREVDVEPLWRRRAVAEELEWWVLDVGAHGDHTGLPYLRGKGLADRRDSCRLRVAAPTAGADERDRARHGGPPHGCYQSAT